jgi:hypothetical protein
MAPDHAVKIKSSCVTDDRHIGDNHAGRLPAPMDHELSH